MGDTPSAAETALAIAASRDRLVAFALERTEQEWAASVLAPTGDARPLGVIIDHVGHAYEYIVGFIGAIVAGEPLPLSGSVIDDLNRDHAVAAAGTDLAGAVARLRRSGTRSSSWSGP